MSRIGLKPIDIPKGVEINISDKNLVEVTGSMGKLQEQIDPEMDIKIEDNILTIARPSETKRNKSLHGLYRSLIANMIEGVTEGYSKTLEISGTGYRAQKQGKKLILNLGYSNPIEIDDPKGIEVEVPAANKIIVKGINKQQVGNYAAVIREYRKPEPYKGKGIKYTDEHIRRKVGKTGK